MNFGVLGCPQRTAMFVLQTTALARAGGYSFPALWSRVFLNWVKDQQCTVAESTPQFRCTQKQAQDLRDFSLNIPSTLNMLL